MMRLVFVSNIPVRTSVQGWVRIPDDTPPELLQAAIRLALDLRGYEPSGQLEVLTSKNIDKEEAFDQKWVFLTPREPQR